MIQVTPQMRVLVAVEPGGQRKLADNSASEVVLPWGRRWN
jgi:hypothetical protein